MCRHSSTWKAFRRSLVRLLRNKPTAEQVWLLLTQNRWLQGKLGTLKLSPLALTECCFQLTHSVVCLSAETIATWPAREFLHMVANHARAARSFASSFEAVSEPRDLNVRLRAQRMVDFLPKQQRAVLTLHLKRLSLTESAEALRLSTYATYSIWREGTQALSKIISAS